MEDCYEPEEFNEYGDLDATACANGDYNTWEEQQVFLDHEGQEDFDPEFDGPQDRYLDSSWEDRWEMDY